MFFCPSIASAWYGSNSLKTSIQNFIKGFCSFSAFFVIKFSQRRFCKYFYDSKVYPLPHNQALTVQHQIISVYSEICHLVLHDGLAQATITGVFWIWCNIPLPENLCDLVVLLIGQPMHEYFFEKNTISTTCPDCSPSILVLKTDFIFLSANLLLSSKKESKLLRRRIPSSTK